MVLVKKSNGKWRIFIDFINLNKACPKEYYPLLSIEKLLDSTLSHVVVSFLNVILGYHQIMMNPKDVKKTMFIINEGVFCYKVMSFGL